MRRSPLLVSLAVAFGGLQASAQVVDESLVPRGRVRLSADPSFTAWDSRFVDDGEISLSDDVNDPIGTKVFPGLLTLEESLRALTGQSGLATVLGATQGLISYDVTRIDLGAHVGVFDWLTVGMTVPLVKNRTSALLSYRPDPAANVGLNPLSSQSEAVGALLTRLEDHARMTADRADGLCAGGAGGAACSDARSLADRTETFFSATRIAYFSTPFFPLAGSDLASALSTATAEMDNALRQAGLPGIGSTMVFASGVLEADGLQAFPSNGASGIQATPIRGLDPEWALGDVEVSALVRLVEGEAIDSGAAAPRFSYQLLAGAVVRLGTGAVDAHDVSLDLPTGDGQTDFEGRLIGALALGAKLGLRGSVRWGMQRRTALIRRVIAPGNVFAPAATLRAVEWSPASYLGVEVAPEWRLTEDLTLGVQYRLFDKGLDRYRVLGDEPAGSLPVDAADLERESAVSLQEAGVSVAYSTLRAWRQGRTGAPLELRVRVMQAVAGSGGRTPVTTRAELSIRLFRGIWGDAPPRN